MSGNSIFERTNAELFDISSNKNVMFPSKLNILMKKLFAGDPNLCEYLINNHTWIRLIICFVTNEDRKKVNAYLRSGNENPKNNILNVVNLFSKEIKYCPHCLHEDYNEFGVCYVHRAHQFKFFTCCYKHRVELISSCPDCDYPLSKNSSANLLSKPMCPNCLLIITDKKLQKVSITLNYQNILFEDICTLSNHSDILHAEYIQRKIMMKMWELNLIHYRGRLMRYELLEKISESFSYEQLEIAGVNREILLSRHFVSRFLELHHLKVHILFYIQIIRYLFDSIEGFLAYENPIANPIPFGQGPWECLNLMCTTYGQKKIQHCNRKLKISGGISVTTTFQCAVCGFTYSRRWMRGKPVGNKTLIVTMGHVWNERVINMYLAGYTPYQIHKETEFSETAIKTCINKLKKRLPIQSHNSHLSLPTDIIQAIEQVAVTTKARDIKDTYRLTLLETSRLNKTTKRIFLLRVHPREYNWLCRNDSDWLDKNFPRKRKVKAKLELDSFDLSLSQKIKDIAADLKLHSTSQVKKYSILNQLAPFEKARFLSFGKERLPVSHKAIKEVIEDRYPYLIRSVMKVVDKCRQKGYRNVSYSALISYSKYYELCDEQQKEEIMEVLRQYQEERVH